jgi:L-fuculose-phosphate aldolase/L-ribulose-5-phosphate 4-epimerase
MEKVLLRKLREKVLDTGNLLPVYDLVWMAGGTACARDSETGLIVVTPSGIAWKDLVPEDLVVVDHHMKIVQGSSRPSVATTLWLEIFKKRIDINAIIHTHSPYATAFSVVHQSLPVITETQANWFGGPIPVTRYMPIEDEEFDTLPAKMLGDGFAVLLGNHGPITVGASLEHALERAVTLEEAAKMYYVSKALGTPIELPGDAARAAFEYYHNRYGQK